MNEEEYDCHKKCECHTYIEKGVLKALGFKVQDLV